MGGPSSGRQSTKPSAKFLPINLSNGQQQLPKIWNTKALKDGAWARSFHAKAAFVRARDGHQRAIYNTGGVKNTVAHATCPVSEEREKWRKTSITEKRAQLALIKDGIATTKATLLTASKPEDPSDLLEQIRADSEDIITALRTLYGTQHKVALEEWARIQASNAKAEDRISDLEAELATIRHEHAQQLLNLRSQRQTELEEKLEEILAYEKAGIEQEAESTIEKARRQHTKDLTGANTELQHLRRTLDLAIKDIGTLRTQRDTCKAQTDNMVELVGLLSAKLQAIQVEDWAKLRRTEAQIRVLLDEKRY